MRFDILLAGESKCLELIFSELFKEHHIYYSYNIANAISIFKSNPVDIVIAQFQPSAVPFIKDAIAIYPDLFILLIVEKDQMDKAISEMKGILFDYIQTPCEWDEINNKLRLVFEICKIKKRYKRANIFSIMTPYVVNAIKSLDLNDLYKRVVDHLETVYPYIIPIICELKSKDKLEIQAINNVTNSIFKKIGYKKGSIIEISEEDLDRIIKNKKLHIDNDNISIKILADLKKEGFKKSYIFPLILNNNIFGLIILAYSGLEDIDTEDIQLWKQLASKLSLIMDHVNILKEINKISKDLKQSQDIIMHQQRLKVLGQMASGISHDLNNIVFPIIGFTELLLEREVGISKQGRKYLYQILGAAEDIRNIVARLRQFYKKREDIEDELELININQVVHEVVSLTEAKWKKTSIEKGINIDIELNLSPDIKDIKGVKSEIREALVNLIFNAVDALINGGNIIINTSMEGNIVKLEVKDTGIGMDKETIEHCLEPFFTTKGEKGTGLGLSIVYGIVDRHGGEIKISSEPGKGTNVILMFPCVLEEKEISGIHIRNGYIIKPLKILYIDDELPVTALVRDILSNDNHIVSIANDGETGINLFKENLSLGQPFDLVITDLVMPKLDGRKVASVIKSISPSTPIILLTGWDLPESQLGNNIDLMLKKPVFPDELKDAIFQVISNRS